MKNYHFINLTVIPESEGFKQNAEMFLSMLKDNWKIISAVGSPTGVQYVLEKDETQNNHSTTEDK